jgi:hypothetical protein
MLVRYSPDTKDLWASIREEIDRADVFLADTSSGRPNIPLELGYAIARKPIEHRRDHL